MLENEVREIARRAAELRVQIVQMMGSGKAHHFGGSLSSAEIVAGLYFHTMHYDPANPMWPERDRFIISKGHSVPAQYAALAMLGVFPREILTTLKALGSPLQGHPAMHLLPGIEGCTGALGEGLSYANGMALAGKVNGLSYRVFCLIGDGELQEGQIWEAAMTTPRKGLTNVVAIIDRNRLKAMDQADSANFTDPLCERWRSFGWDTLEVDGHDVEQVCDGLDWAVARIERPAVVVCNTVKGKGISFMENNAAFHNAAITADRFAQALQEVSEALKRFGLQKGEVVK